VPRFADTEKIARLIVVQPGSSFAFNLLLAANDNRDQNVPMTDRFTDRLRKKADSIWEAQHQHLFVRGIGDGTLDRERFKYWLRQDYGRQFWEMVWRMEGWRV
jgi:TENA/THI-4/PQQC family protein